MAKELSSKPQRPYDDFKTSVDFTQIRANISASTAAIAVVILAFNSSMLDTLLLQMMSFTNPERKMFSGIISYDMVGQGIKLEAAMIIQWLLDSKPNPYLFSKN